MTNEESERIKSMTQDELEDLALKLTEENEKIRIKVNNVSKNSYDITDYSNMRSLAKELKQAARECIKFAVFYEDGEGSLPSGEHLQKFINIY